MITVSLKEILDATPCKNGFLRALHARGKIIDETCNELMENEGIGEAYDLPYGILALADDEQFPAASVVDTEHFNDALWALCVKPEYSNLWRKYAVWCARQVQHLMTDDRSIAALDIAWRHSDGLATDEELHAARGATRDAARDASSGAASRAAYCAVRDAAYCAARDASSGAARAAAWSTVSGAAQAKKLIEILNAGEWV